jgi:acetoin utilization deacetylase AcuC-like enzyme
MKLVWSPEYDVDLFGHVFPIEKYRLVKEALLSGGIAAEADFIQAQAPPQEDLLLVHTKAYLDDLMALRRTHRTLRSEMALTREIVQAYVVCAGGTIEASRWALEQGAGLHIGGGFHHAYPDHAEGFCYINDVAVAAAKIKKTGRAQRITVIDCDLHQGNGTAFAFAGDPDVFTFSIHQENNYPIKERSDLDIGLPDGAGDDLYLEELGVVADILERHKPDIVFYLAGADPYRGDKLGGLMLTKHGLQMRDELVLGECHTRHVPACIVYAGGYAEDMQDVVDIHVATAMVAKRLFG